MEFLKKHYEKLILLVLLLVFIISMIYVFRIISATSEIKESDLDIPTREADYKPTDSEDPQFNVKAQMGATQLHWDPSSARNAENAEFSDLVVMFPVSRCPHCNKLIPRSAMVDGGHCPFTECQKELKTPPEHKTFSYTITADDSDGDGIPDKEEIRLNLKPNDASDATQDKDGDGFSNLCEFRRGTSASDPKSHPPLWYRLRLSDLRTVKIPYKLMAIMTNNSNDKSRWTIQVNDMRAEKTKSLFLNIGDTLEIGSKEYVISDAEPRIETTPGRTEDGTPLVVNNSVIMLTLKDSDETIEMQVGRDVFSPDRKAVVIDTANDKEFVYDVGQRFQMGDRHTGTSTYCVAAIDPVAMSMTLSDPKKPDSGESMVVTREGMIPEEELIRRDGGPELMIMPELMPEMIVPGLQNRSGIGGGRRR